jgi:hypothetical protein
MQRANNIILIAGVLIGCTSVSACKSDDEGGGNAGTAGAMSGGVGGSTGGSAGVAGTMTGGAGGSTTGGMGGVAGTMTTGGVGGSTGGVGGSTGGVGGTTGGMGGMTGGMGGMTGGMGGMTGGMGGGEPDAGGGDSATFTEVYSIIMMKCGGASGCHIAGSSGGLSMANKATAYTNLVGIDSEECDGEKRVIAGDADNSLIIQALEGTADCVDQMPRMRTPLSEDEIATIREWIDDGAMNN